jgi:hypothetical protein
MMANNQTFELLFPLCCCSVLMTQMLSIPVGPWRKENVSPNSLVLTGRRRQRRGKVSTGLQSSRDANHISGIKGSQQEPLSLELVSPHCLLTSIRSPMQLHFSKIFLVLPLLLSWSVDVAGLPMPVPIGPSPGPAFPPLIPNAAGGSKSASTLVLFGILVLMLVTPLS